MNRRLTNAHYRHHYPIKFPYFSDDADGFCVQTKIFKIKSRRKPFFAESSKCSLLLILIDSSPTPALLFFTSLIHTIINYVSIYICFHILFFSRIFITSPSYSYILVSWLLRQNCLHTGSSFYVILKKELFSSHTVNDRRGPGWVF